MKDSIANGLRIILLGALLAASLLTYQQPARADVKPVAAKVDTRKCAVLPEFNLLVGGMNRETAEAILDGPGSVPTPGTSENYAHAEERVYTLCNHPESKGALYMIYTGRHRQHLYLGVWVVVEEGHLLRTTI